MVEFIPDKVVHGLLGSQLGDWRENTKGIAGQQDDIFRLTTDRGDFGSGNEFDWIADTSVFGEFLACIVNNTGFGIQ